MKTNLIWRWTLLSNVHPHTLTELSWNLKNEIVINDPAKRRKYGFHNIIHQIRYRPKSSPIIWSYYEFIFFHSALLSVPLSPIIKPACCRDYYTCCMSYCTWTCSPVCFLPASQCVTHSLSLSETIRNHSIIKWSSMWSSRVRGNITLITRAALLDWTDKRLHFVLHIIWVRQAEGNRDMKAPLPLSEIFMSWTSWSHRRI